MNSCAHCSSDSAGESWLGLARGALLGGHWNIDTNIELGLCSARPRRLVSGHQQFNVTSQKIKLIQKEPSQYLQLVLSSLLLTECCVPRAAQAGGGQVGPSCAAWPGCKHCSLIASQMTPTVKT